MRCIFSVGELELLLQKVVTNLGCALQDKEQADEDLDAILAELDGKPASAQASSTADAAAPAAAEDAPAAQAAEDADNTAVSLQSLTPWCAACLPEAICKLRYMPVPLKQLVGIRLTGSGEYLHSMGKPSRKHSLLSLMSSGENCSCPPC